jgi:hypothetical protein
VLVQIPIEAALLSVCGWTPGKWLSCVRVREKDGSLIPYKRGLRRSWAVALQGSALGIPLISVLTYIRSYMVLSKSFVTPWDKAGGFTVTHRDMGWLRGTLFVSSIVAILLLFALGNME